MSAGCGRHFSGSSFSFVAAGAMAVGDPAAFNPKLHTPLNPCTLAWDMSPDALRTGHISEQEYV